MKEAKYKERDKVNLHTLQSIYINYLLISLLYSSHPTECCVIRDHPCLKAL